MTRQGDAAAVVVAGGQGVRFGGPLRKQYLKLARHPLVWWSLQAFEKSPSFGVVVLVVPEEDLSRVQARVRLWKFRKLGPVVVGGVTRTESVRQGLRAVPLSFRWVAVHDAVRPLVTPDLIERTLQAARRHRAALAACPSKDTVKLSDARSFVRTTPDRRTVWLAQTPQIFQRALLDRAYQRWNKKKEPSTDDTQLVERLGVRVKLVGAPAENIKITVPADLMLAEQLLMERKDKNP